jgi:predicted DNA-binding antitoxin AbrB/MazE fold protein
LAGAGIITCKYIAVELEVKRLLKTVKAVYRNGVIEPLEEMELPDGAEIAITIAEHKRNIHDGLDKSFGGWKGLIDAEKFLKDIYADRDVSTRREVRL